MTRVCGECGAPVEGEEDFCGQCGAYLEWDERVAEEPAAAPVEEAPPVEAARPTLVERMKEAVGLGEQEPAAVLTPAAPPVEGAATPAPGPTSGPPPSPPPRTAPDDTAAARPPEAVQPAAPRPRPPAPRRPAADTEPIRPGDLVCGRCGAGNKPPRKFCRRCGHDLVEAEVATVSWWRRLVPRRRARTKAAGSRPRVRRTRRLPGGRYAVVALLVAALAIGGYAFRGAARSVLDTVLDRVGSEHAEADGIRVSGEARGHGRAALTDTFSNVYWSPPRGARRPWAEATFAKPLRLVSIELSPGASTTKKSEWASQRRPQRLLVTTTRDDGTTEEDTVDLSDEMGTRDIGIGVSDAVKVRLTILKTWGQQPLVAIGELEFVVRR